MATLVFSTAGSFLGGPVGGAFGALIGRQVDAALFGPGLRQGPRLAELAVTASSYGQPLPRHFGHMRVGGAVIWATDLVEHSQPQGGGKGAPAVTAYSYTANFAVALASRPILGIGRIWADGKLLRGAGGDLKSAGQLRIYPGHGDQLPDPLIAASETTARCPACRDLAYVVFEGLDLSTFYNRIPALSFEVFADPAFNLADLVGELIEDIDTAAIAGGLNGFSCDGPLADSLALLDLIEPLDVDMRGERLLVSGQRDGREPVMLGEPTAIVSDAGFGGPSGFARERATQGGAMPSSLRYFDIGRDYQPGVQRASGRPPSGEARVLELPAACQAQAARDMIERIARREDWSRDRVFWRTAELAPAIAPGSRVNLPGLPGVWRVIAWEWRDTGVELSLVRDLPLGADAPPALGADPGRIPPPMDAPAGHTTALAWELPWDGISTLPETPLLCCAVSSESAGWSGAALFADPGDGTLLPLGPSGRARSIVGIAVNALPAATSLMLDRSSFIEVALLDPAMQLAEPGPARLFDGNNLALVGGELVRFARARLLPGGNWRLEGLVRGYAGTEHAVTDHVPSEAFVLLDDTVRSLASDRIGGGPDRRIVALGSAPGDQSITPVRLDGITLRPLSPVHPRARIDTAGTLHCRWTRRARGAWQWRAGVDVPLVEEAERYFVSFGPVAAPLAFWTTTAPEIRLDAATLGELGTLSPGGHLHVRQQGKHALSLPLLLHTLG